MVRMGLSAVLGLWKIMDSSRPRISCSSCPDFSSREMPPKTIRPEVILAAGSEIPMMA